MFGKKDEIQNGPEITETKAKTKKPIHKKWWFWVLLVIIVFMALPGGDGDNKTPQNAQSPSVTEPAGSSAGTPSTSEPTPEPTPEPAPAPAPAPEEPSLTTGQKNALRAAENYLSFTAFSHKGLVEQLEYEGYENADAVYAADNCGADWNEQAAKSAEAYLELTSFSRAGLIEQLEFEGYTNEQAVYGAEANGY